MIIIILLAICALIGSIFWFIVSPDYEPAIATVTSLSALIAAFINKKNNDPNLSQKQTVSESGVGIQAGGNVSIGDIHIAKKAKDAE